jgi:hypothetical protein
MLALDVLEHLRLEIVGWLDERGCILNPEGLLMKTGRFTRIPFIPGNDGGR